MGIDEKKLARPGQKWRNLAFETDVAGIFGGALKNHLLKEETGSLKFF